MTNRAIGLMSANTLADLPSVLHGLVRPQSGRAVADFEQQFAALHGGGRAFAFGAGRVALAAILEALAVRPGDEIIVPGYTCVAVPNPIIFRGAVPIYADIAFGTLNLDPVDVARKITHRTRAILVQHTYGLPAPLQPFRTLVAGRAICIIEDCTHALGAEYEGTRVGSKGDAAFFSSEQSKMVSTGSGGVAFTRNSSLYEPLARFGDQCLTASRAETRRMLGYIAFLAAGQGPLSSGIGSRFEYYLTRLGLLTGPITSDEELACRRPERFLTRLPAGQARVGLSQLRRLRTNLDRRREIAAIYARAFEGTGVRCYSPLPDCVPSWVRFPVWVDNKMEFSEFMRRRGVQVGVWFTAPVHPLGVDLAAARYGPGSCPQAEDAVAHVANLPCHPRMNLADASRVAELMLAYHHAR